MTSGENQADFVLLCQLFGQLYAIAEFEFRITIVIEGERSRPVPEGDVGVEQKRVFVNELAFVTSLRNFERQRDRPAVAEEVALAKLRTNNSAFESPVAEREPDFLALGF